MKITELPKSVINTLWSYDISRIDLNKHKRLVISQVLNFGTKDATDWLFKTYNIKIYEGDRTWH